jgi:hypothetical protein
MDNWKLKTNEQYQELMKIVINLATAALVLPVVFIKDFLGLKEGEYIKPHLNLLAYSAWLLLFFTLFASMLFYYASAKFVKVVSGGKEDPPDIWQGLLWIRNKPPLRWIWDLLARILAWIRKKLPWRQSSPKVNPSIDADATQPPKPSENDFEGLRDTSIWIAIGCFISALVLLLWFFVTLR